MCGAGAGCSAQKYLARYQRIEIDLQLSEQGQIGLFSPMILAGIHDLWYTNQGDVVHTSRRLKKTIWWHGGRCHA
jgi:hypothetical protein